MGMGSEAGYTSCPSILQPFHPAHEAGISDGQIVQEDDMGQ